MLIGLTGPIASGKNEAAKIFRRLGFTIIEADEIAHTLYKPQTLVWQELVKAFGSVILKRGGEINRKKLGEIVFGNKEKLEKLNQIMQAEIREEIKKKAESGTQSTEHRMVVNAALPQLFLGLVDKVWVVMASKETRLRRLIKKGLKKKTALQRIDSQMPQKEYLKLADVIIWNNGTIKQLRKKIHEHVKACFF